MISTIPLFQEQLTGIVYICFFVAVYYFGLAAIGREKAWLSVSGFGLSLGANLAINNLAIVSGGITLIEYGILVASGIGVLWSGFAFMRLFAGSLKRFPRIDRAMVVVLSAVSVACVFLFLVWIEFPVGSVLNVSILVIMAVYVCLSLVAWRRGDTEALFSLIALSILIAGATVGLLNSILPFMPFATSQLLYEYGAVASLALLSLGQARLMNRLKGERERITRVFGTYLSPAVVDDILHKQQDWKGEERVATILFTDIRGYTSLTESMAPSEVITLLNEYYGILVDVVNSRGGMVNKFMGDSIMALFNVPIDQNAHASEAVSAATEILARTSDRLFAGKIRLVTNIGIHTGPVVVGNIGSGLHLEYSVLGDAVNTASRIEELNKDFGTTILVSGETAALLEGGPKLRPLGQSVAIRGKSRQCAVYTIDSEGSA